jgi:predicted AlkP superfamily phosphohydrolase/phosphomutase
MTIVLDRTPNIARVTYNGTTIELEQGKLSNWIRLRFHAAPGINIFGIARFQLLEMDQHFSLYVSPINLDPDKPTMPISHPSYFATYLAKRIGPYATLGLAEDTWALNEGVTTSGTFLRQAYDIDDERRSMFFTALDRLHRGSLVCVFDATDRIQHMFWRYIDPRHPAAGRLPEPEHKDAILDLYKRNDAFIGDILGRLRSDDVLMVISDHGFTSFRRGVNLNAWLRREGYLTLNPDTDGSTEWLRDVDWSRTKAYCMGLVGLFINVRGRERLGIVEPGAEVAALKVEIAAKLKALPDPDTDEAAIRDAFDTSTLYAGPYLSNAPDLLIGYNHGYRTSWEAATGVVAGSVFTDNLKAWSGDHSVDPRLVPGVFFCNRRIDAQEPALIDIAPTALRLFGIQPPQYMDGKVFEVALP